MKKSLFNEIEIPEGVEVEVKGNLVKTKGKEGENIREFDARNISIEKKENKIILGNKKSTKREKKMINTITKHLKNMIAGVQEKFEYKLKICFSHFPMTVELKGNEAIIKNFLGEKVPRKAKILENVEAKLEKDKIILYSTNKELAGQTAANFEKATRISLRDRRIFQDGIFITNKPGKEI